MERFVAQVLRGAFRLRRMSSPKDKKEIIQSLFASIVVKGEEIVSFRLKGDVIGNVTTGTKPPTEIMHLPSPFRVHPLDKLLMPGTKQCLHCKQALQVENFRKGSNRCLACVAKQMRNAYLRRKAARQNPFLCEPESEDL